MLQDLRDIQEGIEVVHASDIAKRKKEAYRERKEERKVAKDRRIERNMKRIVLEGVNSNGEPVSNFLRDWCRKQLEKRGVVLEKPTQMELFSADSAGVDASASNVY